MTLLYHLVPTLNVDNVMTLLKGVAKKWRNVANYLLIPPGAISLIGSEKASDLARLRLVVMYWLLRDPCASWRRLIWQFDDARNRDDDIGDIADILRFYAEELIGQYNNYKLSDK